jgi:hypothetical protein
MTNEEEMAERLDELERKIEEVRQKAEDDDLIDDPDEPLFSDSGTVQPDLDDQEMAPPG